MNFTVFNKRIRKLTTYCDLKCLLWTTLGRFLRKNYLVEKYIAFFNFFYVILLKEYIVVASTRMHTFLSFSHIYRVEDDTELRAPVWFAILFIIVVTAIFASVFTVMEDWSFTKALYFIFITFTTIGFGDIVPRNSEVRYFL